MAKRPHVWKLLGVWYCGQQITARVPRAPLFGSGDTPSEAYHSWVRAKWRHARFAAWYRRHMRESTTVAWPVDENRLRIQSQKALTDLTADYHAGRVGGSRNVIQRAWDAIYRWGGGMWRKKR